MKKNKGLINTILILNLISFLLLLINLNNDLALAFAGIIMIIIPILSIIALIKINGNK